MENYFCNQQQPITSTSKSMAVVNGFISLLEIGKHLYQGNNIVSYNYYYLQCDLETNRHQQLNYEEKISFDITTSFERLFK